MESGIVSYLLDNFVYFPDGRLHRKDRKNSEGSLDKDGYLIIKIKGKQYKAHRLVYAMHYGYLPPGEIDHINRIRTDNRIENLRDSDRYISAQNTTRIPNKDTGQIGIYLDKCTKGLKKKFTTRINRKMYRFYTLDEAVNFRRKNHENA